MKHKSERWTSGPDETRALGAEFGHRLTGEDTVLLYGDLGSGKTVFAQGVALALGIDPHEVQSPTYTLIHEHWPAGLEVDRTQGPRLVHIDLYRLETEEIECAGVDESLTGPGVKLVEWAERLAAAPGDAWMITIEQTAPSQRRIQIRRCAEH